MEQEKIILQKYEPLIYKVAKNFYNVELCDLYQAGSLGLIKAYRNYNENVGKNFINFAYMYIYGEMFEFVNNSQTIKLNKEYLRLSKSIKKAITMLQEELGRTPTTTELSTFLEIDEETIINILNITKESVSLDDKITDDGAYYIDNVLIVNKTYKLTSNWKPVNPYKKVPNDGFDRNPLDTEAYEAWKVMKSDASSIGLNLWAQSGYRSYDYQNDLYNGYIKRKGKKAADTFSARPGASEHQTGLAFDLNTITNSFKDTAEGKWVNKNCYLYGYILRYPEGKTNETGYIYEPWHIRYVGKELAKKLYNNGNWITMEDYFGIDSKYND